MTAKHALIAVVSLLLIATTAIADDKPKGPSYSLPEKATFTARDVKVTRKGDGSQTALKEGETDADRAKAESDFEIAATLNVPKEDAHGKGPYPAVFFVSGSGMQDRNGFAAGMDLGTWELLDAIANAGFVVLRADDRTTGGTPLGFKGIDPLQLGYKALVGDARSCVNFLRTQPEVDAKRIFLIGHSEGGLTAPLLAAEKDLAIAGVICLAGPGRNMRNVIRDQVEAECAKMDELTRGMTLAMQDELTEAIKANRDPDFNKVPKSVWNRADVVAGRKWMREHFNIDVEACHKSLTCPVLVANGAADCQVNPEKDARKLAANLVAGKCGDVTLRIYDDLDHLFKPCGGRPSNIKMYYEKRSVNAGFLQDVVRWLEQHA
ncbi:MAG: alpha/beta hydrolase [Planctomycetes bacterium]|nr:alpha/beta hydrolase [Planctomycetota bacterium]